MVLVELRKHYFNQIHTYFMKTHNLNPFIPPKPDDVREFMEGVQPLAPPIHRQIMETGKQIARATGMTIATVITSPVAIVEAGLYA